MNVIIRLLMISFLFVLYFSSSIVHQSHWICWGTQFANPSKGLIFTIYRIWLIYDHLMPMIDWFMMMGYLIDWFMMVWYLIDWFMIIWYLWLTNLWSSDIYDWLIYDHLISMIDWLMIIWFLWLTDLWSSDIYDWLIYDHLISMID